MMKLLKIEWQKLKPYTFFWIFLSMYFFILAGTFYLTHYQLSVNGMHASTSVDWHGMTYTAKYFNLFLVLIVILYSTNEFQFNTYRQNVIDGLSRAQLLLSKLYFHLLLSLYSVVSLFVLFIIFNLVSESGLSVASFSIEIHFLFYHFLKCFCLFSMAYFLTLLLKKGIISIIVFIMAALLNYALGFIDSIPIKLLPFTACANLISDPTPMSLFFPSATPDIGLTVAFVIGYCILFNGLSYWWLTTKDLKG